MGKSNKIFSEYGNNPFLLFSEWFNEAVRREAADPNAMALATMSDDGKPSVRIVLMKEFDESGFVFFTNYNGGKARGLNRQAYAEADFYWKSLSRQVRIAGRTEKTSAAESDGYFASRARGKQIGAWASAQSQPFEDYAELTQRTTETEMRFAGQPIPRPSHWGGYRIVPERMEFWIAEQDRLHTRFVYTRTNDDEWRANWLFP